MDHFFKEPDYFLPLGYNDNKIVLLVVDPNNLFAYWEISNTKKQNFINQFGQNSWNNSKLVLKVNNITLNKTEYIEINEYANNWYIKSKQPNCIYTVEIGKLFENNLFISLASSNAASTPSNSISNNNFVYFANYKDLRKFKQLSINNEIIKYENIINNLGMSSAIISGISSESFTK